MRCPECDALISADITCPCQSGDYDDYKEREEVDFAKNLL